jgi:biopolymer transport protein ExbD
MSPLRAVSLMPIERFPWALLAMSVATLLSACHVPPAVSRVVLHISATGEFELEGKPVSSAELAGALSARKAGGAELVVELRASTRADMKVVRSAVEATRLAHARISFAREDGVP